MSTLELLRCYYNFVRPHGALKFGREIRTPAMQAGLTTRRLTLSRHLLDYDDSFVVADRGFLAHWGAQPGLFRTCTTARSRVATLDGGSTGRAVFVLAWVSAGAVTAAASQPSRGSTRKLSHNDGRANGSLLDLLPQQRSVRATARPQRAQRSSGP